MDIRFDTKDIAQVAPTLKAGQRVLLSGVVYTSRDAAHKRIKELMDRGEETPYPLLDACVYYAGPTATPPGMAIGSCAPPPAAEWTSSLRNSWTRGSSA